MRFSVADDAEPAEVDRDVVAALGAEDGVVDVDARTQLTDHARLSPVRQPEALGGVRIP